LDKGFNEPEAARGLLGVCIVNFNATLSLAAVIDPWRVNPGTRELVCWHSAVYNLEEMVVT
jgi:hypothetical protein